MKQERNKPYVAFQKDNATEEKGDYVVNKHLTRTLYDGRYCAVSGFLFAVVNGKYSVLANKRGPGTPDFQGCWNCPCGFLERNENSQEGIARETKEETGMIIPPDRFKVIYVETEPELCNNGNVTIRHYGFLGRQYQFPPSPVCDKDTDGNFSVTLQEKYGGEKDEVVDIQWIPIDEVDSYKWAFHHDETIYTLIPPKWKVRLLEFWYSIF